MQWVIVSRYLYKTVEILLLYRSYDLCLLPDEELSLIAIFFHFIPTHITLSQVYHLDDRVHQAKLLICWMELPETNTDSIDLFLSLNVQVLKWTFLNLFHISHIQNILFLNNN